MDKKIAIVSVLLIGLVFFSGCTQQAPDTDSTDDNIDSGEETLDTEASGQIDDYIIEENSEVDIGDIDDF